MKFKAFNASIQEVGHTPKQDILIITDDWNKKLGNKTELKFLENLDLGSEMKEEETHRFLQSQQLIHYKHMLQTTIEHGYHQMLNMEIKQTT